MKNVRLVDIRDHPQPGPRTKSNVKLARPAKGSGLVGRRGPLPPAFDYLVKVEDNWKSRDTTYCEGSIIKLVGYLTPAVVVSDDLAD